MAAFFYPLAENPLKATVNYVNLNWNYVMLLLLFILLLNHISDTTFAENNSYKYSTQFIGRCFRQV